MKKDTLGLYGPEDSKYLRLVERRAQKEGIKTAWVAGPTPGCAAYVADTEAGWPLWDLTAAEDVDMLQHLGLSCCSGAIILCVEPEDQVLIIGRGHAVEGLMLQLPRAIVRSSTALDLAYRAGLADVIINSAPALAGKVLDAVPRSAMILDISGSMEKISGRVSAYASRAEIGAVNIALLLARVRRVIADGAREEADEALMRAESG